MKDQERESSLPKSVGSKTESIHRFIAVANWNDHDVLALYSKKSGNRF
jgi:hypothetical protein